MTHKMKVMNTIDLRTQILGILRPTRQAIIWLTIGLLYAGGKVLFIHSNVEDLTFLIKPVAYVVGLLLGADYTFIPQEGYYFEAVNMVIDKSCSGAKFWLLLIAMSGFSFFHSGKSASYIALSLLCVFTYPITILTNVVRIVLYLQISELLQNLSIDRPPTLHLGIGTGVYLVFLIISYSVVININKSKAND